MANLKLGEAAIDGVIAKLRNGIDARVAAINTNASDDITITPPSESDIYFGGVTAIPRAPALIVFQLPTDGEHEAEGSHSFVWVADIGVAIVDEDYDRARVARKLLRQARAAIEVLWDDPPAEALQDGAFHLRFTRDDPGPVQEPSSEGSFWRAMHIAIFQVRSYQG